MANNPTLVAASLSDKELRDSIDNLVQHVEQGTKKMADSMDSAVERMKNSLKGLGTLKVDMGDTSDGGSSRRTSKQKDLETQVKSTTNAIQQQTQSIKDGATAFDQFAAASQKASRVPSEMRMPDMAKSARESFQTFYKGFNEQARHLDSLIQTEEKRLAGSPLSRFSQDTKSQLSQLDVSIDQTRFKINLLYQEEKRLSQEALRLNVGTGFSEFEKLWTQKYNARNERVKEGERLIELEKERQRVIASDPTIQQLDRSIEQRRAKVQQLFEEEKRLHNESLKQKVSSTEFDRLWTQKYTVRDQRIAEQEKLIQLEKERQSLMSVDPIRTQLTNIEELRAKREQVLGLMRDETTTNNRNTTAIQETTQAASRYTDEIRKQAQAIRETQQWKDKGFAVVDGTVYNDPERSNLAKKDRISLEEQILRKQQEQIEQAQREAQVQDKVTQAVAATAKMHLSVNEQQAKANAARMDKFVVGNSRNASDYEYLRTQIADLLGVQEREVQMVNIETASYNELSGYIKQLQNAYRNLGSDIASRHGTDIANELQRAQRAAQKFQAQMNRPTSLQSALGLPEKSLDDLAYKIKQLQSYMQGLDTSNAKSAQAFQRAAMHANLLKEKQNELLQKNSQLIRSNNELFKSNTALGRSWNYMKNRLAFYFTVGASTQFVKNLIDIRSQYEMNERALGILINSAERGTQIFSQLSEMALVSPYTLIELSNAAKQLTAYDVAAKDVVDTTRRLADMASAVGVPMERLTYALGQIKAYGYLNSRDNRMFANAGIPLVKQLADYYTQLEGRLVSTADVYDRIKKKAVSFEDTMSVIYKMTDEGGKFFDFQEKMAGTLKVQLANLTLAWNNMLNDIGASQQGILTTGIGALKNLFLAWKDLEKVLTSVVVTIGLVKGAQALATLAIGKQTVQTLEYVAANKLATWTEYKRALSIKGLTAEQARWLILTNQGNKSLIAAVMRMGILNAATVRYLATMTGLRKGFAMLLLSGKMAITGLVAGLKSLGAAFIANWPLALLMAGIDLWQHLSAVSENNAELNKNIAEGAKEATKALDDFLSADDKVQARLDAQQKKLSQSQGEKTWESIREQIELSAMSAKQLIPDLLYIPDINKRVTESFNLAERIQKATEALSGLEDELEAHQDSWLWGAFGEGLDEDIEDYIERIKAISNAPLFSDASWWERITQQTKQHQQSYLVSDLYEAKSEIERFANDAAEVIKERLGEEGITDKIQVGEAVERIIKATEQKFPKIRGVGKKLFEAIVSDVMGEQFAGVYDSQEQYYRMFLEQLGKDYGSKFRDVTENIKKETFKWSSGQMDAIQKTADKVKKDLPAASREAIDNILAQLNSTEFKMRIVTEFGTTSLNDVQKAFEERFYDVPLNIDLTDKQREEQRSKNVQKYNAFMRKAGEDNVEYEKRITDEKEKQLKVVKENQAIINKGGNAKVIADAKEAKKAAEEWIEASKEVAQWGGYNFTTKSETKDNRKAESELQKALKEELSLIDKVRSTYKELVKEGASGQDALRIATEGFDESVKSINKTFDKFGLPHLDLSKYAGVSNPREIVNMLQSQLDKLLANGNVKTAEIKELQTKIKTLNVDAEKYDLTRITKGLNNELDKLKDEYELAIALDADPEIGMAFADMIGLNTDTLPHTVKEYADAYSMYLNKYLKANNSNLQFANGELLSLTRDDIAAFQEQVNTGTLNEQWFNAIKKAFEDISGKRKKDLEDTQKWSNSLIEKYGGLQERLTKIYKDTVGRQVGIVKQFGTENQKSDIVRLQAQISVSDNPAELAEINQKIATIVKDVTGKNPIALKLSTASSNESEQLTSKAYWEDFKNSDMYAMTFEDMANNSTRAIQLIIDKLNSLKNKVKEDPASMKALIKSLEDAEKELNTRDPFGGIARSLKTMADASKEARLAQQALWASEVDVERAQQEVDNAEDGTPEEQKAAQDKLAAAINRRTKAQNDLTQAENKGKKAQQSLKSSLQGITGELGNVKSLFDTVSSLFRAGGDNETADAIDAISEGFSIMTTVIMGVVAAMILLEASQPWLLAIAAALSVIVGLVSFLSGKDNERIDDKIKDSELAVKRLENQVSQLKNTYDALSDSAQRSFGAQKTSAELTMRSNQKLQLQMYQMQLIEKKRQLQLEKSRDSKHRDDSKIADLEGEIISLQGTIDGLVRDIANAISDITDDLLGISRGSWAEELAKSMIDAFRQGEDYMEVFEDSWDDMVNNMIAKMIVGKFIGDYINRLLESADKMIKERTESQSDQLSKAINSNKSWETDSDEQIIKRIVQNFGNDDVNAALRNAGIDPDKFEKDWFSASVFERNDLYYQLLGVMDKLREGGLNYSQSVIDSLKGILEDATNAAYYDVYDEIFRDPSTKEGAKTLAEKLPEWLEGLGIKFGDRNKQLSALQQGIQGITENTAGSIEAYLNGVSQQVYLHTTILQQISTTLQGFDLDVQTGTLSEILLQLQSSYQIHMSIRDTLQGWSNANGMAVRVEMI